MIHGSMQKWVLSLEIAVYKFNFCHFSKCLAAAKLIGFKIGSSAPNSKIKMQESVKGLK